MWAGRSPSPVERQNVPRLLSGYYFKSNIYYIMRWQVVNFTTWLRAASRLRNCRSCPTKAALVQQALRSQPVVELRLVRLRASPSPRMRSFRFRPVCPMYAISSRSTMRIRYTPAPVGIVRLETAGNGNGTNGVHAKPHQSECRKDAC